MSPVGRMLILTPNALVMTVEKAKAGDTRFGLPVFPGAVETGLTAISAIYTTKAPIKDVIAFYRAQIPPGPGLMILENAETDDGPSLLVSNQSAEGLAWEMLNVSLDNSTTTRTTTRIIMTRKQD